jgi:hypothetical protein
MGKMNEDYDQPLNSGDPFLGTSIWKNYAGNADFWGQFWSETILRLGGGPNRSCIDGVSK